MAGKERAKAVGNPQLAKSEEVRNGVRVASFFSGGGGLDLGFDQAGFEIVFASDIDPVSCQTLELNSGKLLRSRCEVRCCDIREIRLADLPAAIDLVIGGPPCQSYSASGRRAGGAAGTLDARGTLFEAYIRVIDHLKPKAFLFENVRGIFGTNKGRDWSQIASAFLKIGYSLTFRVLDACDYGVPQHRERVLLLGHQLDGDFLFPRPTHGVDSIGQVPHVTPRQAFSFLDENPYTDLLKLSGGKYSNLLPLVPPGSNYLHFTERRGYRSPIFAYRSRFSDFLYKADPNAPTKTIIASPGKYTGPFHWENRAFSIPEYKAVQGFPQDYQFAGNRVETIRQIGNSVSPLIARHLARAIAAQVFNIGSAANLLPIDEVLSFDKRKGKTAQGTRAAHAEIAARPSVNGFSHFTIGEYVGTVVSGLGKEPGSVAATQIGERHAHLRVQVSKDSSLAISMTLLLGNSKADLFSDEEESTRLDVDLFCDQENGIQAMWNAVDDWVIRSSSFHSLFELYGHFTEPHPIFSIETFRLHQNLPTYRFAKHISEFSNCSRYYLRAHLTDMFGDSFGTTHFPDLVDILRRSRFDIRCKETNLAISSDLYMVCYPFTLPLRRQMNFSVRPLVAGHQAQSLRVSL